MRPSDEAKGLSVITVVCDNEAETARLAETVSLALRPGDLIALEGDLGAGKTTFTRALIRAAANDQTAEVPSPTFTLMQTYENLPFGRLTHLDLYRIEHPEELEELGLDEILIDGVGLVEWPTKAQGALPPVSLEVVILQSGESQRQFSISGTAELVGRVTRSLSIRKFLDDNGCVDCERHHLTGDASARAYETIQPKSGRSLILMNAPAQPDGPPIKNGLPYSKIARLAEDMSAFVGVAMALQQNGFRVPEIKSMDLDQGLLLIENLGNGSITDQNRSPMADRYLASMGLLPALHQKEWPTNIALPTGQCHVIPTFDRDAIMIEVELLTEWYVPFRVGRPLSSSEKSEFQNIWDDLIRQLESAEKSLLLRDYHSPNIIWIDDAEGNDRIGLIDFQDALIGPTAYDVASLAQDARVDVSEELEAQLVDHYCLQRTGFDEDRFRADYAIMAAERATKILGIFVRLSRRDGKHGYLSHLPRIESYLKRSLTHPALAHYRRWLNTVLEFDSL